MTSTIFIDPPDDWFTPPGTLRISPAAMQLARAFRARAVEAAPQENWVISFDWADSRRVRDKGTNNWRDLGAGLDLTAYERSKIKDRHIEAIEDIDITVRIPRAVWENSDQRLIEADPSAFSGLVLR